MSPRTRMRMGTSLAAGTALLLLLGTHDSAPAVARATRGLWRGLAEPRVLAAAREGGQQQPAKPASPPAQQPADTGQQPPAFRAGINYVRVDVIISDKNG